MFLFLRSLAATVIPSVAVPHLARGHLRRHVSARLQPEQPLADGPHHLDRLRGRRRHRDDREHRPLHRGRRVPARGRPEGLGADRLHDRLPHRVADRRADPAPLHGRHRRPALPRVRRHAQRDHPRVGRGLAHADPDDVRQAPASPGRQPSRAGFYRATERGFEARHRAGTARRCRGSSATSRRRWWSPWPRWC